MRDSITCCSTSTRFLPSNTSTSKTAASPKPPSPPSPPISVDLVYCMRHSLESHPSLKEVNIEGEVLSEETRAELLLITGYSHCSVLCTSPSSPSNTIEFFTLRSEMDIESPSDVSPIPLSPEQSKLLDCWKTLQALYWTTVSTFPFRPIPAVIRRDMNIPLANPLNLPLLGLFFVFHVICRDQSGRFAVGFGFADSEFQGRTDCGLFERLFEFEWSQLWSIRGRIVHERPDSSSLRRQSPAFIGRVARAIRRFDWNSS